MLATRVGGAMSVDQSWNPRHHGFMGDAARKIIEAFEALSQSERQEVILEILRRASLVDLGISRDEELVAAADEIFRSLDERERES